MEARRRRNSSQASGRHMPKNTLTGNKETIASINGLSIYLMIFTSLQNIDYFPIDENIFVCI